MASFYHPPHSSASDADRAASDANRRRLVLDGDTDERMNTDTDYNRR